MEQMTIFYLKSSGKIKNICTGEQTFAVFTDEQDDMQLIMELIVVNRDDNVISDMSKFKVNLTTKQLELLPDPLASQYPVAQ